MKKYFVDKVGRETTIRQLSEIQLYELLAKCQEVIDSNKGTNFVSSEFGISFIQNENITQPILTSDEIAEAEAFAKALVKQRADSIVEAAKWEKSLIIQIIKENDEKAK